MGGGVVTIITRKAARQLLPCEYGARLHSTNRGSDRSDERDAAVDWYLCASGTTSDAPLLHAYEHAVPVEGELLRCGSADATSDGYAGDS